MAGESALPDVALPSRICISLGYSEPGVLLRAAKIEADRGELFFEFCLEFLNDPGEGPAIVRQFLDYSPGAWVIVTCRRGQPNFQGTVTDQLALLRDCVAAGARVIDLEIESAQHAHRWMKTMGRQCVRIVSYHNFECCPPLPPVLRDLDSIPADIIKVAVQAGGSESLYRLMEAARDCRKQNLMLAMGKAGLASRVIAPILGRSFTYAAPIGHEGTAPGQLDAATLRRQLTLLEPVQSWQHNLPGLIPRLQLQNSLVSRRASPKCFSAL